ncbi:cytochrome P450 [Conidiobolus coronatus NRRL 28638]|uniref:Cytochrome P450 n=1 Tax=Conidiobolus coronatus (strain ATCC 28846 / CBS 209.66 / NRRL 28638) TaxID=796925 RepID=A0A137PCL1_CONC2|nr:cytochrome P450 [Conidiobolus coronatus NRRL 28638]|eukprot:KXN72739.1 cytochrome P450 [Conidiobolus coronatus NRRL 28638]
MSKTPSRLRNIKEIPLITIIRELSSGAIFIQVMDNIWVIWDANSELFGKIANDASSFDKIILHQFFSNSLLDNMMGINIVQSGTKEWKNHRKKERKKTAKDKTAQYNDILSLILASNIKDCNGLTDDKIRQNTLIFFLGGQDTASLSICAALHLLAEHLEIQEIIRKEVLTVLGKDEYKNEKLQIPTNEQLRKLEYTYVAMQETMKLYSALTVINHRVAL